MNNTLSERVDETSDDATASFGLNSFHNEKSEEVFTALLDDRSISPNFSIKTARRIANQGMKTEYSSRVVLGWLPAVGCHPRH